MFLFITKFLLRTAFIFFDQEWAKGRLEVDTKPTYLRRFFFLQLVFYVGVFASALFPQTAAVQLDIGRPFSPSLL